jgi:hypothetical protein
MTKSEKARDPAIRKELASVERVGLRKIIGQGDTVRLPGVLPAAGIVPARPGIGAVDLKPGSR